MFSTIFGVELRVDTAVDLNGVANLWPILRLKHHNPKGGALKPNRFHPMPAVSATEVARLFSSVALQCLMTCRDQQRRSAKYEEEREQISHT
jgi:hypothetical protein